MSISFKHLDLFNGIGGFSLALESVGFKTIGFSEIDPYCCAILKQHWPKVKNYGDIRTIPEIRCDVVTASHPCQPFSCAGLKAGENDVRFLRPAMLNALAKSNAAWFVYENVPGISKVELDDLLDDLEDLGYETQSFIIPACALGHRHLRNRVWIIAYNSRFNLEKPKMVFPARSISESRKHSVGLSNCIWRPVRQTYLSDMAGKIHGLPDWPHRAKAIGNAIVPQIAEIFAENIMQLLKCGTH